MSPLEIALGVALGLAYAAEPLVEQWRASRPAPPEPQPLAPDLRAAYRPRSHR
jgi:hypothetical protein